MSKVIETPNAPSPLGTYSQARLTAGGTLYLAGQVGLHPKTNEMAADFAAQARQAFSNMRSVLEAAGANFEHVVKVNIFLVNKDNFAEVNTIMGEFFSAPYPARSTVVVASLPRAALIEIEGVAQL